MELSKILTEAEMSQLSPEIVGKIESAYRSELASAIESDSSKQRKQVEKMLECVMQRADKMIGEAVAESVEKYKSNAINDKMYKVLKAVSSCLESAGISFSEELADAKRERKADEQRLKEAYQALNKSKQRENPRILAGRVEACACDSPAAVNDARGGESRSRLRRRGRKAV